MEYINAVKHPLCMWIVAMIAVVFLPARVAPARQPFPPCPNANSCQDVAWGSIGQPFCEEGDCADNFTPVSCGPLTNLCWYGFYKPVVTGDAFSIKILSDNATVPGQPIATFVQGTNLTVTRTATSSQFGGRTIYCYSATLSPPVEVVTGFCYWLSVRNSVGPLGTRWAWIRGTGSPIGDGVHFISGTQFPTPADFAFCTNLTLGQAGGCTPCDSPLNGLCHDDVPYLGYDVCYSISTACAPIATGIPACAFGPPVGPGLWYKIMGTGHQITIMTCGFSECFDARVDVFCGPCDELSCVARGSQPCEASWCTSLGATYYVLISSDNASVGGDIGVCVLDGTEPCGAPAPACCESITLRSGQVSGAPGMPGQTDSAIHRHPTTNALLQPLSASPFNDANWFTPAQAGPLARLITAHPNWLAGSGGLLPCDGQARWINYAAASSFGSVLYAVPFTVQAPCIRSATLSICWAVDDTLGDPSGPNAAGAYINGAALPAVSGGGLAVQSTISNLDVSALVHPGLNWLYFYQRDTFEGVSGLIFSSRLDINCEAIACTPPPRDMVLWLPFDEPQPGTAYNVVGGSDGTDFAMDAVPGVVSRARCNRDGYVDVPNYADLGPDGGDFSVDAWVNLDIASHPPIGRQHTIVHRWSYLPSIATERGYRLYLESVAGGLVQLKFEMKKASGLGVTVPGPIFAPGTWRHVAVTVDRDSPTGIHLFLDGCSSACPNCVRDDPPPGNPTSEAGGLAGAGAMFRVFASLSSVGDGASDYFIGCIDEVEVFSRALSCDEVQRVFNACTSGKCKYFCEVPIAQTMCRNSGTITIPIRVCNVDYGSDTVDFEDFISFLLLPFTVNPVPGCGDLQFTPASFTLTPTSPFVVFQGNLLAVAGGCTTYFVTIADPGFTTAGQRACYEVCFTSPGGERVCCQGSVVYADRDCLGWLSSPRTDLPTGEPVAFAVRLENSGSASINRDYVFTMINDAMQPDLRHVSLNGLPPGESVTYHVNVPPGGSTTLDLTAQFVTSDPIHSYTLVVSTDLDGDGDLDAFDSTSFRNTLTMPCPPALAESFESYPAGRVCGQGGWEEWIGSADACGEVSAVRAADGGRSLKIVGNVGGSTGLGDDTVRRISGATSGRWTFKTMTFVPNDATGIGYLNLLSTYDDPPGSPAADYRWSLQVRFDANLNQVMADVNVGAAPLAKGRWVEFRVEIDLDNDLADYFYDGVRFVQGRSWSCGIGAPFCGTVARIQALDLYGGEPNSNGTSGMYFDAISLQEICPPAAPPCLGDFNADGVVNSQDYFDFIGCFFTSGCQGADFNADGNVNSQDFFDFLVAFFAGCP